MRRVITFDCCQKPDIQERLVCTNDYQSNTQFCTNKIKNSKYTVVTFIPLILLAHLTRFMNLYFIIIGLLQLWHDVSPVNPLTTWAPIIVIFIIAFVREGIDDYHQHQIDNELNNRKYQVIRDKHEKSLISEEISVGDIVKLERNTECPADLAIVYTANEDGSCCIETSNLDGETALKERFALPLTQSIKYQGVKTTKIKVQAPAPCPEIYKFESKIWIEENSTVALSEKQLIQSGVFLRNVEYVLGIVIYTGKQTKLGLNTQPPPIKWTQIEKFIDKCSIFIFIAQICLAIITGSIGNWKRSQYEKTEAYLRYDLGENLPEKWSWIILYVRFYLLTSVMIPISLKVTIDICKYIYATWIRNDRRIFDTKLNQRTVVNNTSVIEDLGAIQYIFSDKTGTLTENMMKLKKISVRDTMYGHSENCDDIYEDTTLQGLLAQPSEFHDDNPETQRQWATFFVMNLILCHSVKIIESPNGKIIEGVSAEEVAFIKGLIDLGYQVTSPQPNRITVQSEKYGITPHSFDILSILSFTYERKRMSVIVRDVESEKLYLFSKGAHEVISTLCNSIPPSFAQQIDNFSTQGLRVMAHSYKSLEKEDYLNFTQRLESAQQMMANRETAVHDVYQYFEDKQTIIGITGIEDQLQEGVPHTVEMLREGGIKIWMVTGDLMNTAIKIARATKLITSDGPLLNITKSDVADSPNELLDNVRDYVDTIRGPFYLVIDGNHPYTSEYLGPLKPKFAQIASEAKCVICSRSTPKQKAQFVGAIQELKKVTLAVGDGGNDVTMIRAAHIGVGIMGKEGRQATAASDFAVTRFEYLQRLLLIHGRYASYRSSWLMQFCFYKSIMLSLVQVGYMFWNGYSGAGYISDFNLMCYNAIFTLLPVIFFLFDKDVDEVTVMLHPYLYSESRLRTFCNIRSMFWWMIRAVYQAIVIIVIVNFCFDENTLTPADGTPNIQDESQQVAYSALILNVLLTTTFDTQQFTSFNFIFIWGNWFLYILFTIFANLIYDFSLCREMYLVVWRSYSNPLHWMIVVTAVSLSVMPILFIQSIFALLLPSRGQQLRYQEVVKQSKFQATYLVDFKEGDTKEIRSIYTNAQHDPAIWEMDHNLCSPIAALCGC